MNAVSTRGEIRLQTCWRLSLAKFSAQLLEGQFIKTVPATQRFQDIEGALLKCGIFRKALPGPSRGNRAGRASEGSTHAQPSRPRLHFILFFRQA